MEGKLSEINPLQTTQKIDEIMREHASHKRISPELVRRILPLYLEELDPNKTYFIVPDIQQWLEPSPKLVNEIMRGYEVSDFHVFEEMFGKLAMAVERRRHLDKTIENEQLPKHVNPDQFKEISWCLDEQALLKRLIDIRGLQYETAAKLSSQVREKTLQRIAKRQTIFEEEALDQDPVTRQKRILTYILKATASALDSHTAYFTPDEATQFMINVQQRLFGIGAQLRDDINGFSVVKIIEGGPAAKSKELKVKDRIVAINGEPVVGMDIVDAVELIRGEENTPVVLTVIRENKEGDAKGEETLNITILREEVVLKETRYASSYQDFGDGAIGYLKLFSFYQDPDSSSAADLNRAITDLQEKTPLKAIILDLRYNSGGMLSQAVEVAGLFISKGIVVSIKDEKGVLQHLRHLDEEVAWRGPLIVLTNRMSASASEIVAGTLQDYGRAIIVGDDHTFGKGSFQTFTLNPSKSGSKNDQIDPEGEFKVTRGRYYTVSGRTPQLTGVYSDIIVSGPLSESEIGEKFAKYPLENDNIPPNFDDQLDDVPAHQRDHIRLLYKYNLQPKLHTYQKYLPTLIANSAQRIRDNKQYQEFLKELKKKDHDVEEDLPADEEASTETGAGKGDLQLNETYNIAKDLLYLMLKSSTRSQPVIDLPPQKVMEDPTMAR